MKTNATRHLDKLGITYELRDYPAYINDSALRCPVIAVSAGVRGTQILLAPHDYIRATTATPGSIVRKPAA
jgi:Cys-tRNA(Pro)/Cys-tRNA(Cys) deacylase